MQIRFLFFCDGVISLSQWDVFSSAHGLESISSTTTDQDFVWRGFHILGILICAYSTLQRKIKPLNTITPADSQDTTQEIKKKLKVLHGEQAINHIYFWKRLYM